MITVDIWGSCVSREILNYTTEISCGKYILQNPIHTMESPPFEISRDQIQGGSRFISDMAYLEFNKKAKEYFNNNFKSNYLIVDTADCRSNIAVIGPNNSRIALFVLTNQTIKNLNLKAKCIVKEAFDISPKEWDKYVLDFCNLILSKYEEKNIILNNFTFATKYLKNEQFFPFENLEIIQNENIITNLVADLFKKHLPNSLQLSPVVPAIADDNHHLGRSSLHFVNDFYILQAKKLERLLGITGKSIETLEAEYYNKYNLK